LTLVNSRSKCSMTWSMKVFSSSALLDMVSNRIWVCFDGLIRAVMTDGQNLNQLGESNYWFRLPLPKCCLSPTSPPGSEAEPRNFRRERCLATQVDGHSPANAAALNQVNQLWNFTQGQVPHNPRCSPDHATDVKEHNQECSLILATESIIADVVP
jgi:hypothetical protein